MRKLCLAVLIAGFAALSFSTSASAISVDLTWTGLAGGGLGSSFSGNTVTVAPGAIATLTLDVSINGATSLGAFFLQFEYDTDLKNELNFVSGVQNAFVFFPPGSVFTPIAPGLEGTEFAESSAGAKGQVAEYEMNAGVGYVGAPVSIAVGTIVFTTNALSAALHNDGDDVFTGAGIVSINGKTTTIGDGGFLDITGTTTFGNAIVNVVPEPGTLLLLALGIGALGFAGRPKETA